MRFQLKTVIFYSLPSDYFFPIFKVQSIPTCKFPHKPKSLTEAEINCQELETDTLSRTVNTVTKAEVVKSEQFIFPKEAYD